MPAIKTKIETRIEIKTKIIFFFFGFGYFNSLIRAKQIQLTLLFVDVGSTFRPIKMQYYFFHHLQCFALKLPGEQSICKTRSRCILQNRVCGSETRRLKRSVLIGQYVLHVWTNQSAPNVFRFSINILPTLFSSSVLQVRLLSIHVL